MNYNINGGLIDIPGGAETVEIHGGIINLYGRVGRLIQQGGIINRFAEMGVKQEPKVVYRDRVIYKDRVVYKDREIIRDSAESAKELKHLRGENKWIKQKLEELEQENLSLVAELEETDRQTLISKVADLEDKLKAARNREHVLIQQRKEADRRAQQTIASVWDEYRPTKEACRQLYENLKAFLDCETD